MLGDEGERLEIMVDECLKTAVSPGGLNSFDVDGI